MHTVTCIYDFMNFLFTIKFIEFKPTIKLKKLGVDD